MLRTLLFLSFSVVGFSFQAIVGQKPIMVGNGYNSPIPIKIAPGQITTFFVPGLQTVLPQPVKATTLPLPTSLAGISLTITQPGLPLPILAIQQVQLCNFTLAAAPPQIPDCLLTAITVQVPYEIVPGFTFPASFVNVSENNTVSKSFQVNHVNDNLHVLNTCDSFPSANLDVDSCRPVVAHADGTLVTSDSPAKAGEEIAIYAFGLGKTSPAVATGAATPSPAPVLADNKFIYVQFDFRPNAVPSPPYFNPLILAPFVPGSLFAGLTPGQVGLYQINVRIPSSLPPLGSCNAGAKAGFPYNSVASNLTIDLGASSSFDGAAICVQPQ